MFIYILIILTVFNINFSVYFSASIVCILLRPTSTLYTAC